MKHFELHAVVSRAKMYVGLVTVVAVMAMVVEMTKTGHMVVVKDALDHVWHWIAHFVSDVASAEVGAAVMFRVFGVGK